ncbi:hypothetical protein HKD37_17G048889 [Glycine soja]
MVHLHYPPSSPPPPSESTTPSSSTTSKKIRKETQLRSLATRLARAERPMVHVDFVIGKVDGPHRKKLRTYLGIIACNKTKFDIPESSDLRTKKKILQTVGEQLGLFKSDLTSKWAQAHGKEGKDDKDVRKKAQAIQKQNTTPHMLSRGGYDFLEKKLMEEKQKKRLEEASQPGSTDTVDSLEEQASQVSFLAHGRQDVLTAAIGRPEHHGHVRVARADVTIKNYFGPTSRGSRTSSSMAAEDLEQLTQKIRNQLEESITQQSQMQSQRLTLLLEVEVGLSATHVSTKEICVDPSGQDPEMGDSNKCGLYVNDSPPQLVALGRVYEGSMTFHSVPLGNDQVKVGLEEVRDVDARVAKGLTKPVDMSDLNVNPLYLMTLTISQLFLKLLQVSWDATMFGVYNDNFPLYMFLLISALKGFDEGFNDS